MHHQLLHIHKTSRQMVSEEKCTSRSIYIHKCSCSPSRDLLLFLAVGKHEQRLLKFYKISAYVTLSLSHLLFFPLPEGKRGRGFVKGWMCRRRQYSVPPVARASMLHCLPDSITCALCFHELITGTLEAWQEHGDHTLMEV